jgi:hypothetical protein
MKSLKVRFSVKVRNPDYQVSQHGMANNVPYTIVTGLGKLVSFTRLDLVTKAIVVDSTTGKFYECNLDDIVESKSR